MKLYDMDSEKELSIMDLYNDWNTFRTEEPWNHSESFKCELHNIIMDTINGRNNCDVIGMTPAETEGYILRLRLSGMI